MITTVVFDVGETLVDETRHWGEWADWMGVPRLTFFAVLGAVIDRGLPHRQVFELLQPGLDYAEAARQHLPFEDVRPAPPFMPPYMDAK